MADRLVRNNLKEMMGGYKKKKGGEQTRKTQTLKSSTYPLKAK